MRVDLLARYDRALIATPIATKACTSAIVELLGDAAAQRATRQFDARRSLAVAVDGVMTGLVLHVVYGLQATYLPSSAVWWVPFCHMIIDEFFVDPAFVAGFIAITDCDWRQFIPTLQASKAVSLSTLPVQWVNFRFVPVRYRVLVVNFIDLLWSAAVSYTAHRRKLI